MKQEFNIRIVLDDQVTSKQDLFDWLNDMVFKHKDLLEWEEVIM